VHSKSTDVIEKDTVDVAIEDCQPDTFERTLEDFWDLLRTRKVVVTDRLHCMIFCAITQTPCVVLPNSNHKIKGTYETWLSHLPHIAYMDELDATALSATIDRLYAMDTHQLPAPGLSDRYDALRQSLLDAAGT
jgi:pyruvyl transferase EpsI